MVGGLHEQAPADAFHLVCVGAWRERHFEHAHVFLFREHGKRGNVNLRRNQHFDELLGDRGRGRRIEFAIERDDAAERGRGVRRERQAIGGERIGRDGDTARIRVLDDHAGGGVAN